MKTLSLVWRSDLLVCALWAVAGIALAADPTPNQLTEEEKAGGWKLLFDGSTKGWRTVGKQESAVKGWAVADGWFFCNGKEGGDILSEGTFEQFELQWEWKQLKGGNSGVKYFVAEKDGSALGHEYQMIDDEGHSDAKAGDGKHVTASFYDVLKPERPAPVRPPGETNHSRIVVRGNGVEHWLNGEKVLTYSCSSEAIKEAIAHSKFKNSDGFDSRRKGPIMLQNHHTEVWFRNVKIRDLSGKE